MKNKLTLFLALAMVFSTTIFASKGTDYVSKSIQTTFSKKFAGATDVNWATTESFVKANFELNGQFMAAYFTNSGEFLGLGRNLVIAQLPIYLQSELKKDLKGAWIIELFEYTTDEETTYYATLENADQKYVKRSVEGNSWLTVKKVKKN